MSLFEIGMEYWLAWGTAEEQMHSSIKVIEKDGTWLKIESEKTGIDPLINIAAPMFISAKKRDRAAERSMDDLRAEMQGMTEEALRGIAGKGDA